MIRIGVDIGGTKMEIAALDESGAELLRRRAPAPRGSYAEAIEAIDGAAKGAQLVFGVILGTGVGGGVVADGRAIEGVNSIAGEWGHNALPWPTPGELPGPRCNCGRDGCIEAFLSGPGLARDHLLATGEAREPADIAARAESGDRGCALTLDRYEERLARALASVINLLDPEVIV